MDATIDFGIDLGTTNSSIALCRAGQVRVFPNGEQSNVTPSVVYVGKSGRMLVGKKAYDIWVQEPQNTQAEFKRWMGFSDRLNFGAAGKTMAAEELSAEVLKSLRADVARLTGEETSAAVITVPAAFGSLQCDATSRAAKLAGFEQSPLLQEPIAAAIAYGAGSGARNQRWMVFDLGGGTLDIAVVSTRNGRLAVLEHQGDNRLGGKDMDRLIAEGLLLGPLRETFNLPERGTDAAGFDRLMRALVRHAEQAKIAVSAQESVDLELFDLGKDRDGKTIELAMKITRAEVEEKVRPLVERCLALAGRALTGARLAKTDLDRVLLVGGPTLMPTLRAALAEGIGAKLDWSLDPMTVVAQGAALYASSQLRTVAGGAVVSAPAAVSGAVKIQISHERASGTAQSPVAGIVPTASAVAEIKIDAGGGFWSSGWLAVKAGRFALEVMLNERQPMTRFTVSGRDKKGKIIPVEPGEFGIAFMLPMAAPPLPHAIAIELTDTSGRATYDTVFKRNCPLPAESRKSYRADRTLRPSEPDGTLPIKFWEIEISDDPQERWWAGCVCIRADQIKRPLVEGSELELTVKIDPSRKMTVEVFVPLLNESFTHGVYIPDPPSARSQMQEQMDACFERLATVRRRAYETDRDDLLERARVMQMRLDSLAEQLETDGERGGQGADPDAALGPSDMLRKIRIQISQLEEQCEAGPESTLARKVRGEARWTEQIVRGEGSASDKQELERLLGQLEKYSEADDPRGLNWVREQLTMLRGPILNRLPWFWTNVLNYLKQPARKFVNQREAQKWIEKAQAAQNDGKLAEMRDAVNHAYALLPPEKAEVAKEQAAQSGVRGV